MRCDLCLLYRENAEKEDRRAEICQVFRKIYPGFEPDPAQIICDGCSCGQDHAVLFDPHCQTRKCVIGKGLPHCGYCDEFPCAIFPAEPDDAQLKQMIDVEKRWSWEEEKLMEAYQCKKNMLEFRRNRKE